MKTRTLLTLMLVICLMAMLSVGGYVSNIVQLCRCDFKPSYKAEVLRGIGIVVPPIGVILGFVTIEDNPESP